MLFPDVQMDFFSRSIYTAPLNHSTHPPKNIMVRYNHTTTQPHTSMSMSIPQKCYFTDDSDWGRNRSTTPDAPRASSTCPKDTFATHSKFQHLSDWTDKNLSNNTLCCQLSVSEADAQNAMDRIETRERLKFVEDSIGITVVPMAVFSRVTTK